MKRIQIVFSVCTSLFALALGAQTTRTLYIDAHGDNGPAGWNNVAFTTVANTALLHDSSTNATGIRASVDIRIAGANLFSAT
ncbi:MAG: hypothetical protein PHU80_08155, partial [Kiritimatiellae bacterium]|nr:hypothetical protein [Kiritimatiellia bacterium]